ncbi:MAG: hypothetical protein JWM21_4087 [Acidobacteria bacterium]|nr:hypothetical protein [Acidobacteriota bacterium]
MKQNALRVYPRMRRQDLVIDEMPDEVLVYDLERHQAHCLNLTAALVWKQCDGRTSPHEIARRVGRELQAPCPEDAVWLALRQLESLHLLEQPLTLPAQVAGMSRRQMVRALGVAAVVAVPLITSIVSPTPADAATCATSGQPCASKTCCAGCTCNGTFCVGVCS